MPNFLPGQTPYHVEQDLASGADPIWLSNLANGRELHEVAERQASMVVKAVSFYFPCNFYIDAQLFRIFPIIVISLGSLGWGRRSALHVTGFSRLWCQQMVIVVHFTVLKHYWNEVWNSNDREPCVHLKIKPLLGLLLCVYGFFPALSVSVHNNSKQVALKITFYSNQTRSMVCNASSASKQIYCICSDHIHLQMNLTKNFTPKWSVYSPQNSTHVCWL